MSCAVALMATQWCTPAGNAVLPTSLTDKILCLGLCVCLGSCTKCMWLHLESFTHLTARGKRRKCPTGPVSGFQAVRGPRSKTFKINPGVLFISLFLFCAFWTVWYVLQKEVFAHTKIRNCSPGIIHWVFGNTEKSCFSQRGFVVDHQTKAYLLEESPLHLQRKPITAQMQVNPFERNLKHNRFRSLEFLFLRVPANSLCPLDEILPALDPKACVGWFWLLEKWHVASISVWCGTIWNNPWFLEATTNQTIQKSLPCRTFLETKKDSHNSCFKTKATCLVLPLQRCSVI